MASSWRKAMALAVVIGLGSACDGGVGDGTLLTHLQVVHVGAEPPEVGPGEGLDLLVTTVDPQGSGADLLVWACTDLGEGCVEETGQPLEERVLRRVAEGEDAGFTLAVDPALAALFAVEEAFRPAMGVWVLACEPGLCPVFALIDAVPAVGSDDDAAVRAFLGDPVAGIGSLPLTGVSLSRRELPISELPVIERNANPLIGDLLPRPLIGSTGSEVLIDFTLWDDDPDSFETPGLATMFGFTTIGGLSPARGAVTDGPLSWLPGAEAGAGTLYVVLLDGAGGSALWRSEVVVE